MIIGATPSNGKSSKVLKKNHGKNIKNWKKFVFKFRWP